MNKGIKISNKKKHTFKNLGMISQSNTEVTKNTAIVIAAMGFMASFVFAIDGLTTWFLTFF